MRIGPGGALIGVVVGFAVALATVVGILWDYLGAWYGSDYMLLIDPPLWLVAVTYALIGGGAALLTGLVLVPVLRRRPRMQRFPGNVLMIVAAVAVVALPFVFAGQLPNARAYLAVVIGGAVIATAVGVAVTAMAVRREATEAEALRRAFADDRS